MTDKFVGGAEHAPAAGFEIEDNQSSSLAEQIRGKLTEEKAKPSFTPKKTVKDIPAIDSNQTRRMTLDTKASYGMQVSRPEEDLQSGAYKVLSAPAAPVEASKEHVFQLICQECGSTTQEQRLTCENCGAYFATTVDVGKAKERARRTQEITAITPVQEMTWQQMMVKRILARSVDLAILSSISAVVLISYFGYIAQVLPEHPDLRSLFDAITYGVLPFVFAVAAVLYSASFEASLARATPGKILFGLVVKDDDGNEVGFSKAAVRAFVIHLPLVLLMVTISITKFFNPEFNELNGVTFWQIVQPLAIVGFFGLIGYAVSFSSMVNDRKMNTMVDMLAGTSVTEHE